MMNQPESVNINRMLYREWFPQIVYNHHQTGPTGTVMFSPPFRDPFNYNYDPLVVNTLDQVGAAMHARFDAGGQAGRHDALGRELLDVVERRPADHAVFPQPDRPAHRDASATRRRSEIGFVPDRLLPTRRSAVPDHRRRRGTSASRSTTRSPPTTRVLDFAQRYRETLLYNIYVMGRNSIRKGRHATPGRCTPKRIAAVKAEIAKEMQTEAARRAHGGRRPRPSRCRRRVLRAAEEAGVARPAHLRDSRRPAATSSPRPSS